MYDIEDSRLDEGAEAARPPRVLVLGVGPAGFSAIFSGWGSGGGEGSTVSQVVGGTGVVDRLDRKSVV